jgi:orotate phosphoribosyltransferase-like protein
MKEIHEVVIRDLGREKERYQRKRSDIFVSYLDKIGKSGADFASLYADEASIYIDNVIEKDKLAEDLRKRPDIKAVVFIDDFVGTGTQVSGYLTDMSNILGEFKEQKLRAIFIAVVSTKQGWNKVT